MSITSRNRTIYQSEALFCGPSPASGNHTGNVNQLYRIQTANYDTNITRQDINQYGQLGAIGREIVQAPTAGLDFSYYVTNVYNESLLGFVVDGSTTVISGILAKVADERNYFMLTVPEGQDANAYPGLPTQNRVIGIGNGFISSYSTEGAVGGVPTASVKIDALNLKIDASSSGQGVPAVNPVNGLPITDQLYTLPAAVSGIVGQPTALRPGDITVTITPQAGNSDMAGIGVSIQDAKIQSYRLGFELSREPLEKLGNRFAFSKEIKFPVTATADIEANIGDLVTGSLADVLCNDREYNITISLKQPNCSGNGDVAVQYDIKGVKLDNQNFQSSIGPNKRVSLKFSTQLTGPSDLTRGLFISGSLT